MAEQRRFVKPGEIHTCMARPVRAYRHMDAHAAQEAVYAARSEANLPGWFHMDAPATPERLRMACADELTAPFTGAGAACKGSF